MTTQLTPLPHIKKDTNTTKTRHTNHAITIICTTLTTILTINTYTLITNITHHHTHWTPQGFTATTFAFLINTTGLTLIPIFAIWWKNTDNTAPQKH